MCIRDSPLTLKLLLPLHLYLGLLQQFGAETDRFGESSGILDLLT